MFVLYAYTYASKTPTLDNPPKALWQYIRHPLAHPLFPIEKHPLFHWLVCLLIRLTRFATED